MIKLQHYVYPQSNTEGRIHQRIIILYILIIFYLVRRKQLLTLNSLVTRVISNPFSKKIPELYIFFISYYDSPCTSRVGQLRMIVVPFKLI